MAQTTIRALAKASFPPQGQRYGPGVGLRRVFLSGKEVDIHRFDDVNHERLLGGDRVVFV